MNNDQRSKNADKALRKYMKLTGCDGDDVIVDILSDLMHWCDRNEYGFWNAIDQAHAHYVSEVDSERKERLGRCVAIVLDHELEMEDAYKEAIDPLTNIGTCMELGPDEYERRLTDYEMTAEGK